MSTGVRVVIVFEYFAWIQAVAASLALLALGSVYLRRRRGMARLRAAEREAERLRAQLLVMAPEVAARERAEAASEAKSRFLANVSHEVRTPLNGILGMADLMSGTELTAEQRSYLTAIRTSGMALASLIEGILDFSKIEAGKLDLVETPFDLAALVEGVVELLAPRAQGKGLEIATSIGADVPRIVMGDGPRLRQVLLNLAGNAVKFTDAGGIGVRVSLHGDRIRFDIEDTGPGVPEGRREAIFDDFEQADGSATRHHDGSGLGLAISRRIVERMGGELRLVDTGPEGSTFAFAVSLPAEPDAIQPPAPPSLDGRKVLIVGRSPFEAPYLAERLASAGAGVERAESPAAALEWLSRKPIPDVVIVDCALGEGAMGEVAAAARAAGVAQSLVLFSPFERRALDRHAISSFDGWLVKPVRSGSLMARLSGAPDTQPEPDAGSDENLRLPRRGLRVLVAEDNAVNALLVIRHLERLGAEHLLTGNGIEAAHEAGRAIRGDSPPFDLILMDIRMPGLDGMEASRRIRLKEAAAGVKRTRIVALTANAFEEDRRACYDAGIDAFLTKPLDLAKLAEILAQGEDTRPPRPVLVSVTR